MSDTYCPNLKLQRIPGTTPWEMECTTCGRQWPYGQAPAYGCSHTTPTSTESPMTSPVDVDVSKHYILDTWAFHMVLRDGTTRSGAGFPSKEAAEIAAQRVLEA